jgi:hypothetical protein
VNRDLPSPVKTPPFHSDSFILTDLPEDFPLSTGDFIELLEEEILFCVKYEGHIKGSAVN